ncbi:MAG TPA: tRNA pseudouridine(55) synthase TruB [Gemmatimonadales bacterium]|nr:tRNA pseudouridine(55) synthase TruB [Gemmatimonadales bacterium]
MLLVAKPAGPTSHDMVDIVRRRLGTRRVGHTGTLDPFAEGLLVMVVGRATRLVPFAAAWTKTYEGRMRLGATTDTDDATGQVREQRPVSVDRTVLERTLARFRGTVRQRPPAYSAVKVEGERAYRRARRGEVVEPAEREVEIAVLEVTEFAPPDVEFRATVSAGTYLRSLARDLGAALGCGGHLAALRRTAVGPFRLEQAVAPEAADPADLLSPGVLVRHLGRRDVDAVEREAVVHGRFIAAAGDAAATPVAMFVGDTLVAVADRAGDVWKPRVVLAD